MHILILFYNFESLLFCKSLQDNSCNN